jgi:hypothetical protein
MKPKIQELREAFQAAKEDEANKQQAFNDLMQAYRETVFTVAEMIDTDPLKLMTASVRRRALEVQIPIAEQNYQAAARQFNKAEVELRDAESKINEAQRVLNTIENPPGWGFGEYTAADVKRIEKRARATLEEMMEVGK